MHLNAPSSESFIKISRLSKTGDLGNESLRFVRITLSKISPISEFSKPTMRPISLVGQGGGCHPECIFPWYPETRNFEVGDNTKLSPGSTRNSRYFWHN